MPKCPFLLQMETQTGSSERLPKNVFFTNEMLQFLECQMKWSCQDLDGQAFLGLHQEWEHQHRVSISASAEKTSLHVQKYTFIFHICIIQYYYVSFLTQPWENKFKIQNKGNIW